jgi:hypothetical protein
MEFPFRKRKDLEMQVVMAAQQYNVPNATKAYT